MAISRSEPNRPTGPQLPVPKRIGRYEVIDRLATGGMAEIFVATDRGLAGLERLVVIKRILPHLAVHQAFVDMFWAEARYVAGLSHPNVVQIFELGEQSFDEGGNAPYLSMEYVAGSSLRDLLVAAIERGTATPIGAAVGIIAQACDGAHAAHELKDPQGKTLGLVHRDISPHNLMVTALGHVKLLDFGIAKATEAALEHTRTGALKGKVHYMAPEQVKQDPLDRRADVFALGIVAWELIAQERLFKRDNELDSMQAIVAGDLRDLRAIRPDVPRDVIAAVERALVAKKEGRYASALEMRKALLEAADRHGIKHDQDVVGTFVGALLGDAQRARQAALLAAAQERTQATPPSMKRGDLVSEDATVVDKKPKQNPLIAATEGTAVEGSRAVGTRSVAASSGQSGQSGQTGSRGTPASLPGPSFQTRSAVRPPAKSPRRTALLAGVLALVTTLVVSALGLWAYRNRGPTGEELVLGVPPVVDRQISLADLTPLTEALGRRLNRPVTLVATDSYDDLGDRLLRGEVDVGVLPPYLYVTFKQKDPRIEALAVKLVDGSAGSDGVLLVREDSAIGTMADIKGKRFCFSDRRSTTGFVLPRFALKRAGLDPDTDVKPHFSGSHMQVLRDLTENVCDAGATYSGGYLAADRAGIPVGRTRQIAITGRSPQDALCAGPLMSQADKDAVRRALLSLDPKIDVDAEVFGRIERITGFAPARDADYDALRQAIAAETAALPD